MAKGKDAERRFSNLSAAAAVLICGVLQVRTLGDGQVVEHLARYNAKGSRAKVSWSRGGSANTTRTTEGWLCTMGETATLQQSLGGITRCRILPIQIN